MKQVFLANLTVLVVDDDASIRMMIGTMLRRLAIKPIDAENGAQAVQLFHGGVAMGGVEQIVRQHTQERMDQLNKQVDELEKQL